MMGGDRLRVALALPPISAHSGGVERCLSLIEHSGSVNVDYTALVPPRGIPDGNVSARLHALEERELVTLQSAPWRDGAATKACDAIVAPTEFWPGPIARARALGVRGPALVEFMQLPYVGTLDILKTRGIESPRSMDLLRLPLVSAKVLGDSLPLSTFQAAACLLSVRSTTRLGERHVLGLTSVVSKNLSALGFAHEPFVPECPVGVDAELTTRILEEDNAVIYDAVYVGRYHAHKGFLDLPRIVAMIRNGIGREVKVAVCGTPQFMRHWRAFQRCVEDAGVGQNMVMLGWQSKADLYRTIASSRMLLYPSYVDSFSIAVLESLCLCVPVVAYAIDALRFVWKERDGIVLAPVGDTAALATRAVDLLVTGKWEDLRSKAHRQSDSLLASYTWERAARSERRFYEEGLLGSG